MRLPSPVRPELVEGSSFSLTAAKKDDASTSSARTEEFAPAAARLAGLAGAVLGWAPGAFWRATPAELEAVLGALAGDEDIAPAGADLVARLLEMFPDG